MQATTRDIAGVTVVDVSGRITLGEGNVILRELVRDLMEKGRNAIVLNLGQVQYIDSSGLGELVKAHATVRNQGGQLKLTNLNKRVHDLLDITHLSAVFDIHREESAAIAACGGRIQDVA
jgi:anti-sigma B factor antagonist